MTVTLVSLMLASALAMHMNHFQPRMDKVKVDLYFQSICPESKEFIKGPLKVAANTKDFWKICDFNLFPWGNANRRKVGNDWEIICQHGPNECEGNIIETCTLKLYDKYTQAIPFIICLEEDAPNWTVAGESCAKKYNLDWNKIHTCATSDLGHKYELEMADATESLQPPRTRVPWFTVNKAHTTEINQKVQKDLVGYVCSVYRGPIKIDACK